MKVYRHIFFDLDHTLWDFDANAKETLSELFIEFSLAATVKAPFCDFYEKYLYHNKILWDRYHNGFIGVEDLKWKRMWRTLLDFRIANETLSKALSRRFLEVLPGKKNIFPYTFEILSYLQNKSYGLHVITNGFEDTQLNKLRNSGLDKYFSYVITSEGSNSLKPKKEIFDYALNTASADISSSIMIGDNIEADIKGALNAGMDCVFINHGSENIQCEATYTITHLSQLENIL